MRKRQRELQEGIPAAFLQVQQHLEFCFFHHALNLGCNINQSQSIPGYAKYVEYVYYSEPQRILYRLPDSTHITQTIAGNTLVTEQPQHSSMFTSSRIMQISANWLIYNDLHENQCNNFHIPNCLDFL